MSELTWQRFVLDREDGDELFAEIARSCATVFVRSGRIRAEPRIEIKQLTSEAAAERSVALRIAKLGKDVDLPGLEDELLAKIRALA